MLRLLFHSPRLQALLIALIVVAGLGALSTLARSEDPKIISRFASVTAAFAGASAMRVEQQVTEPIENALRTLDEVKLTQSSSRRGLSVIQIELKDHITEVEPVWARLRDRLSELAPQLPAEVGPVALDDERGYAFTSLLALRWTGKAPANLAIMGRYAKDLQQRLRGLAGTEFVDSQGQSAERILVELDGPKLAALGLSVEQAAASLRGSDAKVAAGRVDDAWQQIQLALEGEFSHLQRIADTVLRSNEQGLNIRLGDVASVRRGLQSPPDELALYQGQRVIVLGVRMRSDLRIDLWQQNLQALLADYRTILPANIALESLFEQQVYTSARLSELLNNVLQGLSIIVLVLLLTLGWRAALLVGASLPLTVMFTLACMKYYGLPIHQMSVTGLVVALGVMVDNAIVMADSVAQARRRGLAPMLAFSQALRHLWQPLLGSTLTTILAFLPIVLMPGPAGEFVGGIALSVIFSLIGSYCISHFLLAPIAARYLSPTKGAKWWQQGLYFAPLARVFRQSLALSLRWPWLTLLLATALPLAGFILASKLSEQFFPPSDRDMFHIEVYGPSAASIWATERLALQIDALLREQDEIKQSVWFVGNSAPSFYYNMVQRQQGAGHYAQAMVTAHSVTAANALIVRLQSLLDRRFPQAQILVRKLEQGPPFFAPIEVRIFGDDLDQLQYLGEQVRLRLSHIDEVLHTRASLTAGAPQLWLNVNEDNAQVSGLALTQIARQLQAQLSGTRAGSVLEQSEELDVELRLAPHWRRDVNTASQVELSNNMGNALSLLALSEFTLKPSRGDITRRNGSRLNTIEVYLRANVLPDVVLQQLQKNLDDQPLALPSGYRIAFGGESAERNQAVANLLANVGLIVVLMLAVLVLSFNSFRLTALILAVALQAAGLGLLVVALANYPFGFTVIIGLMGLVGLAINAAIVILAELKRLAAEDDLSRPRMLDAVLLCSRHIVSTTITTVGGFMPLLLAGGGFWPPFAFAIAGGTVLTTTLSFYFVPSAFYLLIKKRCRE